MVSIGYDTISANIGSIPVTAPVVCGYVSGSSYIVWSQKDYDRFPHAQHEYIDQGNGTPWRTPTIIDVENGAFSASQIPALHKQYPQAKVYCNQSGLAAVHQYYRGPVWVAAPGSNPTTIKAEVEKTYPGLTVWGVQYVWTQKYDQSVFFPATPPPPPLKTINVNGFQIAQPHGNAIPVVISWWGDSGVTCRKTTMNYSQWDAIKWESH